MPDSEPNLAHLAGGVPPGDVGETLTVESAKVAGLSSAEGPLHLREPVDTREQQGPISSPAEKEANPSASTLPSRMGRYEVMEEIAHGGMGVVFKVRDPDLGRTLAMKVLLDQHGERPDLARRFLEEAQIGGQLQHPGLVPVHELGRLPDDRPFFTMKLVKGRTLAELLKERGSPAVELPRFLGIFEQVCQTVSYTHSRGVIHRDLKPANIMVGAFGEVQVMDWGLAKLLGHGQEASLPATVAGTSTIYSSRSSSEDDSATRAGTVLGTPAYMPPEQARGQVEHLDERCDVFGLGAILCEILTGRPPYTGTREQVIALATEGNLADARARLEECGADAELVKVALQCLAFQPLERPRDAAAVAEAVVARAGVQERARQAELDRVAAQMRAAEERKRRRLVVLLAAVVIVALGAGGGVWLWQKQKRMKLESDAIAAVEKAELLQQEGKWAEALARAQQAKGLLPAAGSPPELRQRVEDRITEIELVQRFEQIRTPPGDTTTQRLSTRYLADAAYSKAFREVGVDVDTLEPVEAAKRIKARPAALKSALIAALDDWVLPRKQARPEAPASWRRLLAVSRAADLDPWRDRLRDAMARDDLPTLKQMAKEPDLAAPVATLQMLAEWLIHVDELETAIGLLRRVQWQHPGDFWVTFKLGSATATLSDSKFDLEEPLRCYATAVALRPDSARLDRYGVVLRMAKRLDDAVAAHERAIQLLPDNAWPYLNLARCLSLKADLERISRMVDQALELSRKAVARDPEDYDAWAAMRLGFGLKWDVYHARGDRAAAREALRNGIRAAEEALRLHPKSADALGMLALFVRWEGDLPRAAQLARKACDLMPGGLGGNSYETLRIALSDLGLLDEAVEAAREGVEKTSGKEVLVLNGLAFNLMEKGGNLDDARAVIDKALKVSPDHDIATLTLAEILRGQGKFVESLDAYRKGHALHAKTGIPYEPTAQWIKDAERRVELDKLLPAVRKGERKPANAAEHAEFGQLCVYKRLYAAAAAFYQQAFGLDPKLADDLGAVHRYQAARAAAMAGCGHDAENVKLNDATRARWRRQARDWLSADLALWRKKLDTSKPQDRQPVLYALNHCRTHDHLAGIRDPKRLGILPADEQEALRKLWAEVNTVLVEASRENK